MRFRFTLKHYLPVEALQFTNNEFEVSIAGWDQINNGSEQGFVWNNPSSVIADASVSGHPNTAAIGQLCPTNPDTGWPPGTYTVAITATNTSTGGSSPFVSGLSIRGSLTGAALDDSISYTGDSGSWTVGAGELTQQVIFTTTQHYQKIFFKFNKQGVGTGYEVIFTIDSIELIRVNGATTDHEISEPDGWKGAKIILERHPEFGSLVEYYEGAAGGAFIFYGENGNEDGGINFIKDIEETYGVDSNIGFVAEIAPDDVNYETIFNGLLELSGKNEMKDNKMQVPVIPNNLWSKFINRMNTPVNLNDNFDLDGNPVDPCIPVTVNLTPQKLRASYEAISTSPGIVEGDPDNSKQYWMMSYNEYVLHDDGIYEVTILPQVDFAEPPAEPLIILKYAGSYTFDIQTVIHDYDPPYNFVSGEDVSDYWAVYININGVETAFTVGDLFTSGNIDGGRVFTLNITQDLEAGAIIKIYAKITSNIDALTYLGAWRWNGPVVNAQIEGDGDPTLVDIECYCRITGDTVYPTSQSQGYLIHDLLNGVLDRIGCGRQPIN